MHVLNFFKNVGKNKKNVKKRKYMAKIKKIRIKTFLHLWLVCTVGQKN